MEDPKRILTECGSGMLMNHDWLYLEYEDGLHVDLPGQTIRNGDEVLVRFCTSQHMFSVIE